MFNFFTKWKYLRAYNDVYLVHAPRKPSVEANWYIHLYESNTGKRKCEIKTSHQTISQENLELYVRGTEFYQTKIYPWLNGRYDPDIPTYNDIPKEDMINKLKK